MKKISKNTPINTSNILRCNVCQSVKQIIKYKCNPNSWVFVWILDIYMINKKKNKCWMFCMYVCNEFIM